MDNSTIRSICRACLSETGEFKSVFVSDNSCNTTNLSEMIMAFASVHITFGDGLPEQICVACAEQTINMYLFKLKCEESDKILRDRHEWSPLQEIHNVREEKYSEYLEMMTEYNRTDLSGTIKSEISIDEPHEDDPSDDKTEVTNIFNETEEIGSDSEKSVLVCNELCKKEFKYELYNKSVCSQLGLDRHIHKSLSTIREFECDTCNKRFSRKEVLIRHKITHAKMMEFGETSVNDGFKNDIISIKTETELYPCPECSVQFKKKDEMEVHVKEHNKVSSNISCHVCTKTFKKRFVLNRHLRIHCRPHLCSTCNKGFLKPEQLANHMKIHSGVKRHICNICLKGFNQMSNLKNHMRIHNGEKPFLCSICHKGFNQETNLRYHMNRHNGNKPFLCSTCGHSFITKYQLSVHLRKHTGERPFVCPICSRGFKTSSSLTKHKRIHSGDKPYGCDKCKMKFTESSSLKRHKRTHTGEKPYVCKYCAKAFSRPRNLKLHLRIHTEEKPYICDVCGQAFVLSSALNKHKKKSHLKSTGIVVADCHEGGANGGFVK